MNKPRVVIIALLVFVAAVAISTLSIEGRASIRPVSARAYDLQNDLPTLTPAPLYTPIAFIQVEMNALSRDGAADRGIMCNQGKGRLLYGCTAFCFDPDADNDPKNPICNKEQRLSYPYGDDSVPWVGIENEYLSDVLSQEMGAGFENITLRAGAITMRSFVWSLKDRGTGVIQSTTAINVRSLFLINLTHSIRHFPAQGVGCPVRSSMRIKRGFVTPLRHAITCHPLEVVISPLRPITSRT
jgi:hypothetical protein